VQVQLVGDNDSPWSNWIDEHAVTRPASQGVPRLSGYGTAPGNHLLAVAATKGGMTSLKHATAERKRSNRYPLYLDAIKSALRRHQRLKKTCSVQSLGSEICDKVRSYPTEHYSFSLRLLHRTFLLPLLYLISTRPVWLPPLPPLSLSCSLIP
jgi:hypothetical protein